MESVNGILDNLYRQIGDSGLIIHAKAMIHQSGTRLSLNEVERLLIMINSPETFFSNEMMRIKLLSTLLYLQAEYDSDKAAVFSAKVEQWQNMNRNPLRSSVNIDHLHLVFNIIEFEHKFKMMNSDKLKLLSVQLSTYEKLEKPFEEYILFKYYAAILRLHQNDFVTVRNTYMDILLDIGEEVNRTEKSSLIQFIELKNQILNIKVLERDSNDKEVLTNVDALMKDYMGDSSDLAIWLGLKASDAFFNFYDYDKAASILQKAFWKIRERLLFSSNKRTAEFVENYLNVVSRSIFCNILQGRNEDSVKLIKKLEKLVNLLKQSQVDIDKTTLLTRYAFYLLIYKIILKIPIDKNELNKSIHLYREKFKNQIDFEDEIIINIYALNSSDVLAKSFFQKVNTNMNIISNNKLLPINYISLFFSLYNQISVLTKNIATDSNTKKQAEYAEKIKSCAKTIVDYVNKYVDVTASDIRLPFNYPYFKEVLIKIYMSYIFSFYFNKEFKKALSLVNDFEILKMKLSLEEGNMIKYCADILKLKADILFKLEDYSQAASIYTTVVQKYEEVLNHSQSMPLVLFNLGLSCLYTKDVPQAKKVLRQSYAKYETLNSINQNIFEDKLRQVGNLISALSPVLNSEN